MIIACRSVWWKWVYLIHALHSVRNGIGIFYTSLHQKSFLHLFIFFFAFSIAVEANTHAQSSIKCIGAFVSENQQTIIIMNVLQRRKHRFIIVAVFAFDIFIVFFFSLSILTCFWAFEAMGFLGVAGMRFHERDAKLEFNHTGLMYYANAQRKSLNFNTSVCGYTLFVGNQAYGISFTVAVFLSCISRWNIYIFKPVLHFLPLAIFPHTVWMVEHNFWSRTL